MAHELDRVALSIGLSGEYFDFDSRYLLAPQVFAKPSLRVFAHECVHVWQQLGSGYLTNLARDRWQALHRWETTGVLPVTDKAFTAVDPDAGFSVAQLSEALCRFWDVHIAGPPDLLDEDYTGELIHDESDPPPDWVTEGLAPEVVKKLRQQRAYTSHQFDQWMLQEDAYAEPYRRMLQTGGSKWAAALFPLVGYFALQTRHPARAFIDSLDRLQGPDLPDNKYISETWREIFSNVANVCSAAAFTTTGSLLTPGAPVMKALAAEGHPVYRHYLALLAMANQRWTTDVRLALPGDPELRQQLSVFFMPPVVIFENGRWEPDSVAAKIGRAAGNPSILAQPQLADAAQNLHERNRAMRKAALLARTSVPTDTP